MAKQQRGSLSGYLNRANGQTFVDNTGGEFAAHDSPLELRPDPGHDPELGFEAHTTNTDAKAMEERFLEEKRFGIVETKGRNVIRS